MDSDGSSLYVPDGWMVGILYIFFESWEDTWKCLTSCNSNTLKAEKALTFLAFFVGAAGPGQLVYSILKQGIDFVLEKTKWKLKENSPEERIVKRSLLFFGVTRLEVIWDLVRESSLCLRTNYCINNDFLNHLTALKLQWCEGSNMRSPDSEEPLPVCDQIFNDSPLIMLALSMIVLAVFANLKTDSSSIFQSLDHKQEFQAGQPSVSNLNGSNPGPSSHENSPAAEQNEDSSGNGGSNGHQTFYADCPDCQKAHLIKVPNPLVVECPCKANTSPSPSTSEASTATVCTNCGQHHSHV